MASSVASRAPRPRRAPLSAPTSSSGTAPRGSCKVRRNAGDTVQLHGVVAERHTMHGRLRHPECQGVPPARRAAEWFHVGDRQGSHRQRRAAGFRVVSECHMVHGGRFPGHRVVAALVRRAMERCHLVGGRGPRPSGSPPNALPESVSCTSASKCMAVGLSIVSDTVEHAIRRAVERRGLVAERDPCDRDQRGVLGRLVSHRGRLHRSG